MNATEFQDALLDIYGKKNNRVHLASREFGYSTAMLHHYKSGAFKVPDDLGRDITLRQKVALAETMNRLEKELSAAQARYASVSSRPLVAIRP